MANNDGEKERRLKHYGLLRQPVITEKSSLVSTQGNTVVFRVASGATKPQIKEAIERIYKVKVEGVRTVNYMGKPKRTTRSQGRRAAFKKAYVSIEQGKQIDVVEGL